MHPQVADVFPVIEVEAGEVLFVAALDDIQFIVAEQALQNVDGIPNSAGLLEHEETLLSRFQGD
jgi:hypothetical protein